MIERQEVKEKEKITNKENINDNDNNKKNENMKEMEKEIHENQMNNKIIVKRTKNKNNLLLFYYSFDFHEFLFPFLSCSHFFYCYHYH